MKSDSPSAIFSDLRCSIARLLATGFGAGNVPLAPGTAGSLIGLLLFLLLSGLTTTAYLGVLILLIAAGTWSAGVAECEMGKDDSRIIVDEICGMLATFAAFPPALKAPSRTFWTALALGFLAFRFFDIAKVPPLRRIERLPGGFGIVGDDLMAAVYANLLLRWWAGV